jgi:hypothetical protein
MSKVQITLRNYEGNQSVTVDGWLVIIPELPDYQFAVHHPWGSTKGWKTSEMSTGMSVGSNYPMTTKKHAIEAALDRHKGMSPRTKQMVHEQITKVLASQVVGLLA